jgi:hypothetical protein
MRRWIILPSIVVTLGCAEEVMTPSSVGEPVLSVAAANLVAEGDAQPVQVEVTYLNATETIDFLLTELADGIALALKDPPQPGNRLYRSNGSAPVSGILSPSIGSPLFDAAGNAIGFQDLRAMRRQAGLPAQRYDFGEPGARDGEGRPIGRVATGGKRLGRVITPERASRETEYLRAHAQSETRVGESLIEFRSVEDRAGRSWVFDERIGAVVRQTLERNGALYMSVENEYTRGSNGPVLASTTSHWYDAAGGVVRTVTTRFPER